ncbi:MAG: carbon-nitrogen family hydrolase [Anaerolineales bacterium]|nr:carbon-nitrogen family hydrolase [Anaerolineales bacterium]
MKISLALAQLDLKRGDPENNFLKAQEAVLQASNQGAEIVLLPELWASGFDLDHTRVYASSLGEGWFARMRDLAAENEIALGGSMIEKKQGEYFNTFVLYNKDGDLLGSYRKIHLFQKLQEDIHFAGGNQIVVVDSPWGKLGLAICYDLRFPEIFRSCAVQGAELILLVAEWPLKRIEHWKILLQARAIENQCFIAAVNKAGISQGAALGGNSAVVSPMGEFLALGGENEELLQADLDLDEVSKIREWMPVFDDRRPGVY